MPAAFSRRDAAYRKTFGGVPASSTKYQACWMLSCAGFTGPLSGLMIFQFPGSSSLSPPENCVSDGLSASGTEINPGRAISDAQSVSAGGDAGTTWLPSAPWNVLPGSGLAVVGRATANASADHHATHATVTTTAASARASTAMAQP